MSWNTLLLQCSTDGIWFKKNWITTDSLLHLYTAYFNEYLNQNCYDSYLLKFSHALQFFFLSLLNYCNISFFKIYIWSCHFPDLMDFSYSCLKSQILFMTSMVLHALFHSTSLSLSSATILHPSFWKGLFQLQAFPTCCYICLECPPLLSPHPNLLLPCKTQALYSVRIVYAFLTRYYSVIK